jgi:hypothetical protein
MKPPEAVHVKFLEGYDALLHADAIENLPIFGVAEFDLGSIPVHRSIVSLDCVGGRLSRRGSFLRNESGVFPEAKFERIGVVYDVP